MSRLVKSAEVKYLFFKGLWHIFNYEYFPTVYSQIFHRLSTFVASFWNVVFVVTCKSAFFQFHCFQFSLSVFCIVCHILSFTLLNFESYFFASCIASIQVFSHFFSSVKRMITSANRNPSIIKWITAILYALPNYYIIITSLKTS